MIANHGNSDLGNSFIHKLDTHSKCLTKFRYKADDIEMLLLTGNQSLNCSENSIYCQTDFTACRALLASKKYL